MGEFRPRLPVAVTRDPAPPALLPMLGLAGLALVAIGVADWVQDGVDAQALLALVVGATLVGAAVVGWRSSFVRGGRIPGTRILALVASFAYFALGFGALMRLLDGETVTLATSLGEGYVFGLLMTAATHLTLRRRQRGRRRSASGSAG